LSLKDAGRIAGGFAKSASKTLLGLAERDLLSSRDEEDDDEDASDAGSKEIGKVYKDIIDGGRRRRKSDLSLKDAGRIAGGFAKSASKTLLGLAERDQADATKCSCSGGDKRCPSDTCADACLQAGAECALYTNGYHCLC